MATVGSLVFQGSNRLRYLVTATDTTALTITTTGATSPDLLTDTVKGPIRKIAKAFTDGYAKFAAGALTQAQARAIWLNDNTGASVGNVNTPRAQCQVVNRVGVLGLAVEANVDGSGHPTVVATPEGAGTWYLDVFVTGAIGA